MTTYLIDSDVFVRAKNEHYGFSLCPGFWDWLDQAHAANIVASVQQVYQELLGHKDQLTRWAQQRRSLFLAPNQSTLGSLSMVSSWANGAGYRQSAVKEFLSKADFYLVAQAHAWGCTVVTHEVSAPGSRKIKIPDACNQVNVRCTTPHAMLLAEGAVFDLRP